MRHFHAKCVKMTHLGVKTRIETVFFTELRHGTNSAISILRLGFGRRVKRDEKRMKTLLRRVSTGLYFQGPDQWTDDAARAHNFKMIDRAIAFVDRWQLQDIELAFAFDDPEDVTTVPLDKMELRYSEG
jgi:hypothetical protein